VKSSTGQQESGELLDLTPVEPMLEELDEITLLEVELDLNVEEDASV